MSKLVIISRLLRFALLRSVTFFFQQMRIEKQNQIPFVHCSHAFSRAWRRLHVLALSSDWFVDSFNSCDWLEITLVWLYDYQMKTALKGTHKGVLLPAWKCKLLRSMCEFVY